jgi:hypothetical protein
LVRAWEGGAQGKPARKRDVVCLTFSPEGKAELGGICKQQRLQSRLCQGKATVPTVRRSLHGDSDRPINRRQPCVFRSIAATSFPAVYVEMSRPLLPAQHEQSTARCGLHPAQCQSRASNESASMSGELAVLFQCAGDGYVTTAASGICRALNMSPACGGGVISNSPLQGHTPRRCTGFRSQVLICKGGGAPLCPALASGFATWPRSPHPPDPTRTILNLALRSTTLFRMRGCFEEPPRNLCMSDR